MSKTIDQILRSRSNRAYKSKSRGSAQSYVDLYENALIFLAHAAGHLSEGQCVKILGVERITFRSIYDEALQLGSDLGSALYVVKSRVDRENHTKGEGGVE